MTDPVDVWQMNKSFNRYSCPVIDPDPETHRIHMVFFFIRSRIIHSKDDVIPQHWGMGRVCSNTFSNFRGFLFENLDGIQLLNDKVSCVLLFYLLFMKIMHGSLFIFLVIWFGSWLDKSLMDLWWMQLIILMMILQYSGEECLLSSRIFTNNLKIKR